MKKISLVFLLAALVLGASSCKKWLDVLPNAQIKESELFRSEAGFKEALSGVYTILTEQSLYGKELTYGMMGVLSQEWAGKPTAYDDDGNYNYTATMSQSRIDNVWATMYKALSNTNNIIENIDNYKVFTGDNYSIIKGEALALRAFMHFDLLRCFGAAYTVNPAQPAIPYVTKYTSQQTQQVSVGEVAKKILEDLLAAKALLKADPIFTGRQVTEFDDNGYLMNRQLHLNYYAVEGLLARLYLYMGDYEKARASASAVVASGKFSFTPQADLISGEDLCGATEHLFALQINNLTQYSINFLSQEGTQIFSLTAAAHLSYYENNTDDYRYLYLFQNGTGANADRRYLLKFAESTATETYYQNKMSIIKLAEMYYILAECDQHDGQNVLDDVNPVRKARGLQELTTPPADFRTFMTNEFRKEFIGEGQLFFYYKRLNQASIQGSDKNLVGLKAYIFPLPASEYEAANRVDNR